MKNSTLYMAIVMMAFLMSCGGAKEESPADDSVVLGSYISLSDAPAISEKEVSIIQKVCGQLQYKEDLLSQNYAGQEKYFSFVTQTKSCTSTQVVEAAPQAKIVMSNGVMIFQNNSGGFLFTDIILRTTSKMKEFCDLAVSNGLTKRYITSGNKAQFIYSQDYNGDSNIVIQTGYTQSSDKDYQIQISEEYLLNKNGFAVKRLNSSIMGCNGGSNLKYSELKSVN